MKGIGGFFELELPMQEKTFHPDAIELSTGRACLAHWINSVKPKQVWLPDFTCNALYEPFEIAGIPYCTYSVDEHLEIKGIAKLAEGEYLIYINYYGLKNVYALELSRKLRNRLLLDNTHAFFWKEEFNSPSFTSARKYFGVPDGAYIYGLETDSSLEEFPGISLQHNVDRLMGKRESAYAAYVAYEKKLTSGLYKMSEISRRLLAGVDYEKVMQQRKENFKTLHSLMGKMNAVPFDMSLPGDETPFCYPFWTGLKIDRSKLHQNGIFVPMLWPETLERCAPQSYDYRYTNELLPLPIDHRYDQKDMEHMAEVVLQLVN